ncbi:MAG: helix-turn-helix domain-containing protein [Lachnospiraceae bacterium]|nr:helix-turn-helix domain-containing protein [Lachnospiraceae bacterium]
MDQFRTNESPNGSARENRWEIESIIQNYSEAMSSSRKSSYVLTAEDYVLEVGDRFRAFREDLHFSQDRIGLLMGVSQSTVSKMERGTVDITLRQIYLLKKYFPSFDSVGMLGKELFSGDPLDQKYISLKSALNTYGLNALMHNMDAIANNRLNLR